MATVFDRSGASPAGYTREQHIPSTRTSKPFFTLLSNASVTGNAVTNVPGGDYIWNVDASNWNGATATLQALGLDGVTWSDLKKSDGTTSVAATAKASIGVGLGQKAVIRVNITGAVPTNMNSNIAGL